MPIFPSWIYMGGETREEGRELEREGKGAGEKMEGGERGGTKGKVRMYEDYHRDDL